MPYYKEDKKRYFPCEGCDTLPQAELPNIIKDAIIILVQRQPDWQASRG